MVRRLFGLYFVCSGGHRTFWAYATWLILGYNFVVFWTLVLPHIDSGTRPLHAAFSAALAILIFANHTRTMYGDPGFIPLNWRPHENSEAPTNAKQRRATRKVVMCLKCNSVKPEEAHHCSKCNRW